jgi:predicted amidophosphoribosyltransferase
LAHAVAYGSYEGGLSELVHRLKFNGVRPAAKVLGRMLAEAMATLEFALEPKAMKQLPLEPAPFRTAGHPGRPSAAVQGEAAPARIQLGGTDRTSGAAVSSGQRLLATCSSSPLAIRNTHSQIGLTSHQRRASLRGAFAVTRAAEVTGRQVLVVDDVYTTGTTATECARVLRPRWSLKAGGRDRGAQAEIGI